ncbi:hypothetical protein BZG36_03880 [Bifiguratus adelaidae]|uniref:Uncharacterized protein n=1 Tax=Bifiguratus adelaidae TaxID=1938954 RepID=A0A261XXM4_9FUNG|nr:hypothetical protein BZG36_03880 [Bifiguratus adelaidae]
MEGQVAFSSSPSSPGKYTDPLNLRDGNEHDTETDVGSESDPLTIQELDAIARQLGIDLDALQVPDLPFPEISLEEPEPSRSLVPSPSINGPQELRAATLEAYQLNKRCQEALSDYLKKIDDAIKHNTFLLTAVRNVNHNVAKAHAIGHNAIGYSDAYAAALPTPPVKRLNLFQGPYFNDEDGNVPPENEDIKLKRHTPQFEVRKWTDKERETLARAVRNENLRLFALRRNNIDTPTSSPSQSTTIRSLNDARPSTPTAGVDRHGRDTEPLPSIKPEYEPAEIDVGSLDWNAISERWFKGTRSPAESRIQWTCHDHPTINKGPWTKSESLNLVKLVEKHGFYGHWVEIALELGTNRTAAQCFQQYQQKLNTDIARRRWTTEDDRLLQEAVAMYGEKDWQRVASVHGNRTGQQCLHRWSKTLNPAIRRGRWREDEDKALRKAVSVYGSGNWVKIAQHVLGRTDVQCRERWMNVLSPEINNGPWTPEEDEILLKRVADFGEHSWSAVADKIHRQQPMIIPMSKDMKVISLASLMATFRLGEDKHGNPFPFHTFDYIRPQPPNAATMSVAQALINRYPEQCTDTAEADRSAANNDMTSADAPSESKDLLSPEEQETESYRLLEARFQWAFAWPLLLSTMSEEQPQGSFKRLVQVGRVVYVNHGEDAGKLAVVVEVIDHKRALIHGPTTGVTRQSASFRNIVLTPIVLKGLTRGAGAKVVAKHYEKDEVDAKWAKSAWAQKLDKRQKRAALSDFDRFKLMKLRKQRRAVVAPHFAKLRKQQA